MAEVRAARMGLSPRMRGNIGALVPCDETDRPIPLHTGEPKRGWMGRFSTGAYPRACGEPSATSPFVSLPRAYPRACGGTQSGRLDAVIERGLSRACRGARAP